MGNWYNGYDWSARNAILTAVRSGEAGSERFRQILPCDICHDPDRPLNNWHSEDYSRPFTYQPPQSYPLCNVCHSRLHKRFAAPPGEWALYKAHLQRGGYGREFTKLLSLSQRRALASQIVRGVDIDLPTLRQRDCAQPWWDRLSCDPLTLRAAWARPRPIRPRPTKEAYKLALSVVEPSPTEWLLLRDHAARSKRSATMRALANLIRRGGSPSMANLMYGRLARRIAEATEFDVDRRKDGSPIWMTSITEGWKPEGGEYEWVMVPSMRDAVLETNALG